MTESAALESAYAQSLPLPDGDKGIHCIQQQSVSKLSRNELEDLFYQLYDENIHIKKKFNSLDNKYKVMSTRVMRLSRDHKCVDVANREEDQKQLRQLRQTEAALRAKITVLRGQLASHTRLHSAALSKLQRPRSSRSSRECRAGPCSSCGGDDRIDLQLDSNRGGTQSRDCGDQSHNCNTSQSGSQTTQQGPSNLPQTNIALREQVLSLQERIAVLEKDMKFASDQSRQRINELEGELASHLSHETAENVELIRARRVNKQQEAVITSLQQEHQEVFRQLEASKMALAHAARDQDAMCSALERERQRNVDLQHEIVKLTHTCASLRDVEEQLNDLKKENAVLKEHSNKLLQLSDSHHAGGDAQHIQMKTASVIALDVSESRGEQTVAEHLLQEQSLLQQQLKVAQSEVADLQKSLVHVNEERYRLHQEVSKARKDCADLQKELMKPCDERKELMTELAAVRKECAQLVEEISKVKTELHEKQLQLSRAQQELHEAEGQNQLLNKEHVPEDNKPSASMSSVIPQSFQHSLRPLGKTEMPTQSQPITPRPRIGDACLTLLEQTAVRPSGSSLPGMLGSHVSLQERFLELCLPPSSPSASSTPLPSVEDANNTRVVLSTSRGENLQNISTEGMPYYSSKQAPGHISPRAIGLADTQWELEKCRELLRVQCNLNSIYKKEVASLNNIVKTLTTSPAKESHD